MDGWGEQGGFFPVDNEGSTSKSKPASRQQFLYPATVRQVLEAPEDGIKFGENSTSMVTIIGIVVQVHTTSTNVTFTVSDDTGVIECIDWIETDDLGDAKKKETLMENNYYQVFGSIKSPQGKRRIMVFKVTPIEDYNLITAHMAEVLTVTRMALKGVTCKDGTSMSAKPVTTNGTSNSYNPIANGNSAGGGEHNSRLNAQQVEILNILKDSSNNQVGVSRSDPILLKRYPQARINEILEHLQGEGMIYSTIDDDHFAST